MNMSLYQKYIKGEIEIKDLSQQDFNKLMVEWFADYKSRNGKLHFIKWLKMMEDYVL
jgi:hypothetical protein